MGRSKHVLRTLASVAVLVAATAALTGCFPDTFGLVRVDIMPITTQPGAANPHRSGLDVHAQQASWVESGASEKGNVKFISPDNTVSTIATQALEAWTAIGGNWSSFSEPLVAYRTDTTGVHVVNPLTSVETTFLAGVVPDDFGDVWVATQVPDGSATDLRTINVLTGATLEHDSKQGTFSSVRTDAGWICWINDDELRIAQIGLDSSTVRTAAPGVTLERAWVSNGEVSWTEVEGGYRKIFYRPAGSSETTEVHPGGPSKEMGGFDGNYVTWFEGYGTAAVKARAVAVDSDGILTLLGEDLTYTGYDPASFAWDFDTLLWQQRGTDKLFLTRFRPTPPRIIGGNRYETLANMAKLRRGVGTTSAGSAATVAEAAGLEASVEADSVAPISWGTDIVVAAGYSNGSPDAIVAPGLCGVYNAPLLLVDHDRVPAVTAAAIATLREANGGSINIHVVGGTSAVSALCYRRLSGLKGTGKIDRVGGHDRYATAALVAGRMKAVLKARGETMGNGVMLLNGSDRTKWDDAASTGALSAGQHMPVLFLRKYSVPADTTSALKRNGLSKRYIIGGTANVSDAVRRRVKVAKADRIYGRDTYRTSMAIVRWGRANGWLSPQSIMIAGHLHEALGAGAFSMTAAAPGLKAARPAYSAVPVALSRPNSLTGELATYLVTTDADGPVSPIPFLIGGEYSVGTPTVRRILELLPDWYGRIY